MKLLIAGNLANTGYFLTSSLRGSEIIADLLMEKDPKFTSDPINTGELQNRKYPNWIKFVDKNRNWKREIVKIMRSYDLISAATEFPIFAMFSLKPYIAIATGSDLRELAQSNKLKGIALRRAYRKAKVVVFTDPDLLKSVEKLKLKNAVYIPPIRDFDKFPVPKKNNNFPKGKFIFFHPTNHIWEIKKNDIFLKAFIRLAKNRNDVYLIAISRGEDADKSFNLLNNSGIEGKFEFLSKSLSQEGLISYFQNCDVAVDQFGVGSFGSLGIEAMSMGKPLISFIDEKIYEKLYEQKPPVLSSNTEDGIYEILLKLVNEKQFCENLGKQSCEWIKKFHSNKDLVKKYINLYQLVNEKNDFSEIKLSLIKKN